MQSDIYFSFEHCFAMIDMSAVVSASVLKQLFTFFSSSFRLELMTF